MRRLAAALLAVPVIASLYLAALVPILRARPPVAALAAGSVVLMVGATFLLTRPTAPLPPAAQSSVPPGAVGSVLGEGAQTASGSSAAPGVGEPAALVAGGSQAAATAAPLVADPAAANIGVSRGQPAAPTATVPAATTVQFSASQTSGNRLRLTSGLRLRFDRPVTLRAVNASLAITPAVKGTVTAVDGRQYIFTPSAPLAPNTAYTVRLHGSLTDTTGRAIATPQPARFLTVAAPALIRFRPMGGTGPVDATQLISVRFTLPMNRVTTSRAFAVVIAGRRVPGTVTWAEGNTVAVFKPARSLPAGARVGVRLLGTATSADGVEIRSGGSATFAVAAAPRPIPLSATRSPKPLARPRATTPRRPVPVPTPVRKTKPTPAPTPVPPPAVGGGANPIEGVDVSHHEGAIDWRQVAAAGKRFAYIKASEGTAYVDPTYATNRANAEQAGLRVGAFHYAQPDTSPGEAAAEADHFVQTAGFRSGELVPMLDLEVSNGLSSSELETWVAAFLDRVYARTGLRAGIYVSPDFWRSYLADTSAIAAHGYGALWIAHWTTAASPSVPASNWDGQGWTIWQYSDRASVAGISRPADVDRFSGSDLARLMIQ